MNASMSTLLDWRQNRGEADGDGGVTDRQDGREGRGEEEVPGPQLSGSRRRRGGWEDRV